MLEGHKFVRYFSHLYYIVKKQTRVCKISLLKIVYLIITKLRFMNKFIALIILVCSVTIIEAQSNNYWKPIEKSSVQLRNFQNLQSEHYLAYELNLELLQQHVNSNSSSIIQLPDPMGNLNEFFFEESSNMEPGLQEKFPNIKSYKARSKEGKYARFTLSDNGLNAIFQTDKGNAKIAFTNESSTNYLSYFFADHYHPGQFKCGVTEKAKEVDYDQLAAANKGLVFEDLVTYRMAIATTAEFSNKYGGTVSSVLNKVNNVLSDINFYYELEVAIHFNLIENNDIIIFFNSVTDGYSNNSLQAMLGENQARLSELIGGDNYDIGHVFGSSGSGGAIGIASLGSACNPQNKARGATSDVGNMVRTMLHEVGHQFSANHTFNYCDSDDATGGGNANSGTSYEPGGGSTIMAYATACGQNAYSQAEDYFHINSLLSIYSHSRNQTCGMVEVTDNNKPEITFSYPTNFTIPKDTPFKLSGSVDDEDTEDNLLYNWEQYTTGPATPLGTVFGNAACFRSYSPGVQTTRVFPRMSDLANNFDNIAEILPNYARNFNFMFTARDGSDGHGSFANYEVKFKSINESGPFLVSYPNGNENFEFGEYVKVEWDVANTFSSSVNCKIVNIRLSTNSGNDYPHLLVQETPNDGEAWVFMPEIATNNARIMVEAADNIFFDIGDQNFTIKTPSSPKYTLNLVVSDPVVCLPDNLVLDLETKTYLDYSGDVTLEFLSGLPAGTEIDYSSNPIPAGENGIISLTFLEDVGNESYNVLFRAIGEDNDTTLRIFDISLISNDFSQVETLAPTDGLAESTTNPTFEWLGSDDAAHYILEIATLPNFSSESIVYISENLTETSHLAAVALEQTKIYYYRVTAYNDCTEGIPTIPKAFQTAAFNCNTFQAEDLPKNISATGSPSISSKLFVNLDSKIGDVNIPKLRGFHSYISNLEVHLISPSGKEVLLFDNECLNGSNFNLGFDDESPFNLSCPLTTQQIQRPEGSLTDFVNEDAKGDWTLRINDNLGGDGGSLEEFTLELCTAVTAVHPTEIRNDTIFLNRGAYTGIRNSSLKYIDQNNTSDELIYTIVEDVENGKLIYNSNVELSVGDQFTQRDINQSLIKFKHDSTATFSDFFTFTITDEEGGFVGTPKVNFSIGENFLVNVPDLEIDKTVLAYPNPASEAIYLEMEGVQESSAKVSLMQMDGKIRYTNIVDFKNAIEIGLEFFATGVYILKVENREISHTQKIVINPN